MAMMLESETEEVRALDDKYVMHTYARLPVVFTQGAGAYLWDADGRRYLDFLGGIAVNAVGHCHPRVVAAIQEQAATLIHTSNLYFTEPQARLAERLCQISDFERVFFCNSGAEANEAALKIARKHGKLGGAGKFHIVTAHRSFHGRTMGTVSATAQPKYQDPFRPLVPGFEYVPLNDIDALKAAVTEQTCAVMLEPVQGEGGVYPAEKSYLEAARRLCDKVGALLIFDEVQTGMGRTGKWWAYQHYGVVPDIMTLAKALGGGVPIGACLTRGAAATTLVPGDHGSTFAGNPLAASAALAAIEAVEEDGMIENAKRMGERFAHLLSGLRQEGYLTDIRGLGLMLGADLKASQAKAVMLESLSNGLIINAIGERTLRFLPPLLVTKSDIEEAFTILSTAIEKVCAS